MRLARDVSWRRLLAGVFRMRRFFCDARRPKRPFTGRRSGNIPRTSSARNRLGILPEHAIVLNGVTISANREIGVRGIQPIRPVPIVLGYLSVALNGPPRNDALCEPRRDAVPLS
jgi:hypothetical protein